MSVDRSSSKGERSIAEQRTEDAPPLSPGKVTLTSQLPPVEAAIQRRSTGMLMPADTEHVRAAAAHGTSGTSAPLPHADAIRRSFGRHDVGQIQAHVDERAAQGAEAMGAAAFATGNHVAFKRSPDLHTVAHEAAHVVQQRGGVQLKGGVGEAGDPHERHADAVADLVVQGKSSESLLDRIADPTGVTPSRGSAIQHLLEETPAAASMGNSFSSSSPNSSLRTTPCRANIQFELPRSVLISPLWLMNRHGCARSHEGNVLVANREWTIAKWLV